LAGAAASGEDHELALADPEGDVGERGHLHGSDREDLRDPLQLNHKRPDDYRACPRTARASVVTRREGVGPAEAPSGRGGFWGLWAVRRYSPESEDEQRGLIFIQPEVLPDHGGDRIVLPHAPPAAFGEATATRAVLDESPEGSVACARILRVEQQAAASVVGEMRYLADRRAHRRDRHGHRLHQGVGTSFTKRRERKRVE